MKISVKDDIVRDKNKEKIVFFEKIGFFLVKQVHKFKIKDMNDNKKTDLQLEFESQTPTIKGIRGNEYNLAYCAWLELQVERLRKNK